MNVFCCETTLTNIMNSFETAPSLLFVHTPLMFSGFMQKVSSFEIAPSLIVTQFMAPGSIVKI